MRSSLVNNGRITWLDEPMVLALMEGPSYLVTGQKIRCAEH